MMFLPVLVWHCYDSPHLVAIGSAQRGSVERQQSLLLYRHHVMTFVVVFVGDEIHPSFLPSILDAIIAVLIESSAEAFDLVVACIRSTSLAPASTSACFQSLSSG